MGVDVLSPCVNLRPGERGMGLVLVIFALLILSLLAIVLIANMSTGTKASVYGVLESKALNSAEAGVAEAIARIRSGDLALSTANPNAVGQLFLTTAGSVPELGTDSVGVETKQPTGSWLAYSTPERGPNVLTVRFKTDAARTVIYKYDPAKTPPVNTATGLPIYVISSTGQQGGTVRRVVAEVIEKPFDHLTFKGALVANHDIDFSGNGVVCGYNHTLATSAPAGEDGRLNSPSCVPFEVGEGDLPGSWTTGNALNTGAAYQTGVPAGNATGQAGFYAGPWEVVGFTQPEFYTWVGTPLTSEPASPNGIFYLDNDNIAQNQKGNFAFHGVNGEGFLYVDGDLTLNSSFTYKGLIYIEGDLKINGQAWVLGAVVVRGKSKLNLNGGMTILYSSDAIQLELAKYRGEFMTLSWREQ